MLAEVEMTVDMNLYITRMTRQHSLALAVFLDRADLRYSRVHQSLEIHLRQRILSPPHSALDAVIWILSQVASVEVLAVLVVLGDLAASEVALAVALEVV